MNRILSQAIRKAVSEYSPKTKITNSEKRPDLFSLSNETELFQNEKGLTINAYNAELNFKKLNFKLFFETNEYWKQCSDYNDLRIQTHRECWCNSMGGNNTQTQRNRYPLVARKCD